LFEEKSMPSKRTKRATTVKTPVMRKAAVKRELIDTGTDKRYVRRDAEGQFHESDDVGRSLSQDRKRQAKTESQIRPRGSWRS